MLGLSTPGIIDQMPSHEEGEFELVLGNKQLLSVFFLVILLLGVFFSMGYIVGRNTAPATTLSASSRTPPIIVDSTGGIPAPPPYSSKPSALDNPRKVEPPAKDPIKTQPVVVEPIKPEPVKPAKPEPVKPEPVKPAPVKPLPVAVAKVEPPKPEPVKPPQKAETPKPKPEPVKPAPVKPPPVTVKGGNYLQVVATKRPDAEKVVASLSQKGFAASITPVPDSSLVRVVVGPLAESAIAKTREGLNAAGYKPMLRKF